VLAAAAERCAEGAAISAEAAAAPHDRAAAPPREHRARRSISSARVDTTADHPTHRANECMSVPPAVGEDM
jgi:hypothetical protein